MATQPLPLTRAGKYVTFQISRHYFAIEASRVRQVGPSRDIVPYDHPMPLVCGVVVLRGRRIPVVDIRDRLGFADRASHPRSSVMLIDTLGISGLPLVGLVADKMTDVVEFRDRDFRANVVQLRPYGRPYGRPKTLLNLDTVLSQEEIAELKAIF